MKPAPICRWLLVLSIVLTALSGSADAARAPRVETNQIQSKLIGVTFNYNVILPEDYQIATATRYPVLYLLHGLSGHYSDWVTRTNIADYAASYRMIVVMPEGNNGWYTDSATVPGDKYESYILRELLPDVDRRYRTIQTRYGRAVAGLSMGGFAAIKFGLKFPDTFIFAGSMSAAIAAAWTESDLKTPGLIRDTVMSVFGPAGSETHQKNDPFQIVAALTPARTAVLPYFYFDCGTEDGYLNDNERLAALFREHKIPHEFRELPGSHNWAYWDQQVREVLKIAAARLAMPPSPQQSHKRPRQKAYAVRRQSPDRSGTALSF